jgi:hypothetical protein
MDTLLETPPAVAGEQVSAAPQDVIWHHPAICQIALPLRAPAKGLWQRDAGASSVTIEAGAGGLALPSGKFLRLLLMHIFDLAVRTASPVVELGENSAELARRMGLDATGAKLRELEDQAARLAAARIGVAYDGGAALAVFDARGRARSGGTEWRPSLRLNARFFDSLKQHAVALDRRIVAALSDATLAFDTYAWLACALPSGTPDGMAQGASLSASWEELRARFGAASQQIEDFRSGFEQTLQQISATCPQVSLVIRDAGVEFRLLPARREEKKRDKPASPAAPVPPAPAAAAAPEPVPELAAELAAELASTEPVQPPPAASEPAAAPATDTPAVDASAAEAARLITRQTINLKPHQTGLGQVIWLQRANGRENIVIEVSPGGRYDPDTLTVLALEPMILQISGGLNARDFERVAAWAMTNRDLIDAFWDGDINSFDEINERVKKVPAPGWR